MSGYLQLKLSLRLRLRLRLRRWRWWRCIPKPSPGKDKATFRRCGDVDSPPDTNDNEYIETLLEIEEAPMRRGCPTPGTGVVNGNRELQGISDLPHVSIFCSRHSGHVQLGWELVAAYKKLMCIQLQGIDSGDR